MRVVAVERIRRSVCAAMYARVVVGEEDQNGGLWCSPSAKTSRPTSSACWAMRSVAWILSASLGVVPSVGSWVMSLTVKMPNCIPDHVVLSLTIASPLP
jgi:hypothetical protein